MRIAHFLFIGCFLMLSACQKKDNPKPKEGKKYDVNFVVSDFTASVETLKGGASNISDDGDTLKNHIDNIYLFIYDSSNKLVETISQTSTASDFGKFLTTLPSGTYTVKIYAAKKDLIFINRTGPVGLQLYCIGSGGWNDTFSGRFTLTVASSAVTKAVRLERIVAALELNLTDSIPANVARIELRLDNEVSMFPMSDTDGRYIFGSRTYEFPLSAMDNGIPNKKFLIYILNTRELFGGMLEFRIRALDSKNALVAEKALINLVFPKNRKAVVSGSLFSSKFTGEITVNPTWDVNTLVYTF